MDGPRGCHTDWSKSDRERQISYDITYMWNPKPSFWIYLQNRIYSFIYKWIYLQNRNIVTDTENKLMVTKRERVEEG